MRAAARGANRFLALLIASVTVAVSVLPGSASAIDTGPRAFYVASVSNSGVQVGGTFTPVVGNFAGGSADDIFWYAPGTAADHLWTSTGRGTFAKQPKSVNGRYTPLVGDFAGDSYDDIVWYAPGTAADVLWTSVPGPSVFQSSGLRVDGTYQPVVLDGSIDLAIAVTGYLGSLPRDTIIWYRPGAASDTAWGWQSTGTYVSYPVTIEGSPQLIPFNANGDPFEDLLAYTPGSGPDAVYISDTGALLKTPKTVNGTYRPTVLGGGYRDAILWHGAGSATDAFWANFADGGLTSQPTQPIGGASVWPTGAARASGYVYNPSGPDRGFVDGYDIASTDGDVGAGALPFVADFDGDLGLDTYFYRPGSATDVVRFGEPPVLIA